MPRNPGSWPSGTQPKKNMMWWDELWKLKKIISVVWLRWNRLRSCFWLLVQVSDKLREEMIQAHFQKRIVSNYKNRNPSPTKNGRNQAGVLQGSIHRCFPRVWTSAKHIGKMICPVDVGLRMIRCCTVRIDRASSYLPSITSLECPAHQTCESSPVY